MNIMIVDDEKLAIDVLSIMVKQLAQFQINIKEHLQIQLRPSSFLKRNNNDVVF